jgi:hypothetical protein
MAETWTYIDANTIEVTGDLTTKYLPNQLLKLTQGSVKFFVITAVALVGQNTRLTVNGGGIYVLTSAAITTRAMAPNGSQPLVPTAFTMSALIHGAASKTTPIDTDEVAIWDSETPFGMRRLTWTNLKATLKTYFDGLYTVAGDLAVYVKLAGRTGGQTVEGDTAASGDLTLSSTHHATKGKIKFGTAVYDEVNNWLGLGITPTEKLHIYESLNGVLRPTIDNPNTGAAAQSSLSLKCGGYEWIWYVLYSGGNILKLYSPALPGNVATFSATGNFWVYGDCSALTFTDRTPTYTGDALAEIQKIKPDHKGDINHNLLPDFAKSTYRDQEGKEKPGRDIGAMVSVLTVAIQQLIAKNEELNERMNNLERN